MAGGGAAGFGYCEIGTSLELSLLVGGGGAGGAALGAAAASTISPGSGSTCEPRDSMCSMMVLSSWLESYTLTPNASRPSRPAAASGTLGTLSAMRMQLLPPF